MERSKCLELERSAEFSSEPGGTVLDLLCREFREFAASSTSDGEWGRPMLLASLWIRTGRTGGQLWVTDRENGRTVMGSFALSG